MIRLGTHTGLNCYQVKIIIIQIILKKCSVFIMYFNYIEHLTLFLVKPIIRKLSLKGCGNNEIRTGYKGY